MIENVTAANPRDLELLEAAARTKAEFVGVPRREHTKVLRRLIDEAEIVLGIFVENGDLRTRIIKGELQLETVVHTKLAAEVRTRVIHVRQAEEAIAIRQILGDGARLQ